MKLTLTVVLVLVFSAPTQEQEKPITLDSVWEMEVKGGSITFNGGSFIGPILTCVSPGGSDPEDYYDCKIEKGHDLDGVIRFLLRQMKNEQLEHARDRKALLRYFRQSAYPRDTGGVLEQ